MEETKEKSKKFERWPAHIMKIGDIKDGKYVKVEEEFSPDHIVFRGKKISRADVIAIIVSKKEDERFNEIVIDDGTGTIIVRDFDNKQGLPEKNIGEIVRVIAKPRVFNDEIYLALEIIKQLKNNKWLELRKMELEKAWGKTEETQPKEVETEQKVSEAKEEVIVEEVKEDSSENTIEKLLRIIKETDKGDGADIEDVIVKANIQNGETMITNLIKEGEIFEIRPGRVKVL